MSVALPIKLKAPLWWLALLIVCAAGAATVWYASAWGVGVSPDSAEYLAGARRLHSLGDLFRLPTQWPPGYPILLKLASLFGGDLYATTRVLQCLLMAGNLAVAMSLLRHVIGRDSLLPIAGGLVLAASYTLWQVNFYAWSEGPFVLCQQLSALWLLHALEAPVERRWLFAAAGMAALALLFRYAGVAWVGTASLLLLLLTAGNWRQRLRPAVTFGVVAVAPFAVWIVANKLVRNETTNRQMVIHWITGSDALALLREITSWFGSAQGLLPFVIGAGLVYAVLRSALRNWSRLPQPLRLFVTISAAYVACYTLFIVLSKSLFDAYIPFDDRIFVVAWLFAVLALTACALQLFVTGEKHQRTLAVLTVLFFIIIGGSQLLPVMSAARQQGMGYLSAYMSQVSPVGQLRQLTGRIVYSNAPDYLRMTTDFTAHDYPRKYDPTTMLVNAGLRDELATMQRNVQRGDALIVHYQGFEWREYFLSKEELLQLGYQEIIEGNGVDILSFPAQVPDKAAAAQ
ncbi:MAG TPA: hypothetical protein VMH83_02110 [Candidatus Acidoferrum sp.]|nr:hypothetical protein [Candidatus Acidoferrum sp.]